MSEPDRLLVELVAAHDALMRQQRRDRRRTLTLAAGLAWLFGEVVVLAPAPYNYVALATLGTWILAGLWSLRPGSCLACGRYTTMILPAANYRPRPWWDLRPIARGATTVAVCMEHIGPYMVQRVVAVIRERP